MSYFTHKQLFFVDSHRKLQGSHSNFTYFLDIAQDIEYDGVCLLDASIPKSAYQIHEKNNTFIVVENSINNIIEIPIGNYTRASFRLVLKEQLNKRTYKYDVTYDNGRHGDTGLFTYTCLVGINPTFIFDDMLHEQMGFNAHTEYTFVDNTLISQNVTNFRTEAVYYIKSDICSNTSDNILSNIISSSTNDFEYINYQCLNPNEFSRDFSRVKSNKFHFIICDEDFNEINLVGLNVVFTLMLFKRDRLSEMLKMFLKTIMLKE